MSNNRNWFAVITADLLYDQKITARQKLLAAIISNMANAKGYCFASNKVLSEYLGVSISTVQRDINELESKNYIGRVVKLKQNGEVDYRALTPMSRVLNPTSEATPPHSTDDITPHSTDDHIIEYNIKRKDNKEGDPVFQNFLEQYYELSSKPQTSKNRLSSEREWAKLAPTDKYQASEKIKEFVEYRKQTQEEQFGSWESKFIPAPENYLKDRLWEELPNKVYVYAEEYHGVHGSGHRWRYSANDKPALIGQKRVYWERKEGKKNRAYVYE